MMIPLRKYFRQGTLCSKQAPTVVHGLLCLETGLGEEFGEVGEGLVRAQGAADMLLSPLFPAQGEDCQNAVEVSKNSLP
jgi:hypothetical protein